MKSVRLLVIAVSCVVACARAPVSKEQISKAPTAKVDVAIVGATVIDLESGALRPQQTLLIRNDEIVAVGPSAETEAFEAARTVEAAGAYLVPGFWDGHTHSVGAYGWHFPLFLEHGVTGIRNMHTGVPFAQLRSLRQRLQIGDLRGPRVIANGPLVDGPPKSWPGAIELAQPADAAAVIQQLIDGEAAFVKVYDKLRPDVYTALLGAAAKAGLAVHGHIPVEVDPIDAVRMGHRTDEHLIGVSFGCSTQSDEIRKRLIANRTAPMPQSLITDFEARRDLAASTEAGGPSCENTMAAYKSAGVFAVPTLVQAVATLAPDEALKGPWAPRLPAPVAAEWSAMASSPIAPQLNAMLEPTVPVAAQLTGALYEAGVSMVAGTDVGNPWLIPGDSLHRELELLVQSGLSPLAALRSATVNVARLLNATDTYGTLAVGGKADVVVLSANPLDDIRNTRRIKTVISRGRVVVDR